MKLQLLAILSAAGLYAQQHDFDCYVQAAETRMAERKTFFASTPTEKIQTMAPDGPNPHKVNGAMIYDWIGTMLIKGTTLERLIRMLQDYDHRAQYFPEIISTSKLLCRTDENHFVAAMRMKEPAVIDTESDVTWERVDPKQWRCRSYSTKVQEIGKQHNYLLRLNTYWRFAETGAGVQVEAESITLSREFGSLMRTLGSMMGINPEKSLKKTLESMRESVLKPGADFAKPPDMAACGPAFRPAGCVTN